MKRLMKCSYSTGGLVHLHMPLVLVLQALHPLLVLDALAGSHSLEHVLDARHHTLQTAEVDVSTLQREEQTERVECLTKPGDADKSYV